MSFLFENRRPGNPIISILYVVLFVVILWFIIKGIFKILYWLTPAILILVAILDYKVFIDLGKSIVRIFQKNIWVGLIMLVAMVIGFPFVAAYLLAKALLNRKISKMKERAGMGDDKFADYEIVEEEDAMDLPSLEKNATVNKDAKNE